MKFVTPQEAQALLAQGAVELIDVRNPNEFAAGHVPGAKLVPLDQLRVEPKLHLTRDHLLFVCAKGGRSQKAAELAEQLGFTDVSSLDGGTEAWAAAGLPIAYPLRPPSPSAPPPTVEELEVEAPMPELDAIIGKNLRALRDARGLSLDAMAKLSGLSRTLLGQIELGTHTPGVNVVWRIARAFDVPFAQLLSAPRTTATTILRKANAKRLVSADERFSSRALFPFGDSEKVEFYELWLAAHARDDAEAHQPGTKENLVVTRGQLVLEIAGARHELNEGDAIVFGADVPHSYVNLTGSECVMHLVMTYA